jgi:hypothetical protein
MPTAKPIIEEASHPDASRYEPATIPHIRSW